ncbi:protein POLR1D [Hyalella azteca]|uniref:Protein POLR1D n=1 Tax=Hyalella azteca TaxID=294128 RepID=A0A8B7MZC4_HYAAZ|nr:protein POLR1D [Hyalella azteca]
MASPSDNDLTRLAAEALMREAVRGAARASLAGPSGWRKPNRGEPNKKFLANTIRGAVFSNKIRETKLSQRSNLKKEALEELVRDSRKYKKKYLKASTKSCNVNTSLSSSKSDPTKNEPRKAPLNDRIMPPSPSPGIDGRIISETCVVWTEENYLELRPVTEEERKSKQKEKSLLRAKKKLRSLNFIPAKNAS